MAIAVDIFQTCIEYIRGVFFPIDKKFWLKLGFVSLLSTRGGGNTGPRFNSLQDMGPVIDFIKKYWRLVLTGIGILAIFSYLWNIIQNTFTFIFLDSVLRKKVEITKGFGKHVDKGFSLFLYNLVIGISFLILLAILLVPIVLPLLNNLDDPWTALNIPYTIFAVVAFLVMLLFFGLMNFFVYNFVLIEMYTKNIRFWPAFKKMLTVLKKEWKEMGIFFLLKVVVGIASALIALIVIIIVLIVFVIIAGIFAVILYAVAQINNMVMITAIIVGVLLAILLILLFIYALAVILVPIPSFMLFFSYLFVTTLLPEKARSGSARKAKQASRARS